MSRFLMKMQPSRRNWFPNKSSQYIIDSQIQWCTNNFEIKSKPFNVPIVTHYCRHKFKHEGGVVWCFETCVDVSGLKHSVNALPWFLTNSFTFVFAFLNFFLTPSFSFEYLVSDLKLEASGLSVVIKPFLTSMSFSFISVLSSGILYTIIP